MNVSLVWFWTSISQSFVGLGQKKTYQRKSYWRRLPQTILWLSDNTFWASFLEKPSKFCDRVYGHRNVKAEKCANTLIFFDFCSLEWPLHWQKPLEEHVCIWGNKLSLGMLAAASMFTNWNFFAWDLMSLFQRREQKRLVITPPNAALGTKFLGRYYNGKFLYRLYAKKKTRRIIRPYPITKLSSCMVALRNLPLWSQ